MLQSIAYFDQPIQKYWTDENYFGYIYLTYDQKRKKGYVGHKFRKIEDSEDYFGSGSIISRIKKKRGANFLKKIILGVCYSEEELIDCETECKHFFNLFDKKYGYNILEKDTGGDTITNNPRRDIICKNMSIGQKGKKYSQETIKQRSAKRKGKKLDEKIKQKLRKPKSKKRTVEHCKNLGKSLKGRTSWNKGLTKETDERLKGTSEKNRINMLNHIPWNKGKKGVLSEDSLQKMSTSHKNKESPQKGKTYIEIHGEEKAQKLIKKLSDSHKGKKFTGRQFHAKGKHWKLLNGKRHYFN